MIRDDEANCIQFMITESKNGYYVDDAERQERMCSVVNATIIDTCILELPIKCKKGDIVNMTFDIDSGMVKITAIYKALYHETDKTVRLEFKADIKDEFSNDFANLVIE